MSGDKVLAMCPRCKRGIEACMINGVCQLDPHSSPDDSGMCPGSNGPGIFICGLGSGEFPKIVSSGVADE